MMWLMSSALFPVLAALWSYHKLRLVHLAIEQHKSFIKMDTLISKMKDMNDAIRHTGVRGRHAAECLGAMMQQIQLVSECTEIFVQGHEEAIKLEMSSRSLEL